MSELEELRKRRMQELLQQKVQQQTQEQLQNRLQEEQIDVQIKSIIQHVLTPQARERLGNIKIANPQIARNVEILLIQLYQAGKIPQPLSDSQFKEILVKLKEGKRKDIKIERR